MMLSFLAATRMTVSTATDDIVLECERFDDLGGWTHPPQAYNRQRSLDAKIAEKVRQLKDD